MTWYAIFGWLIECAILFFGLLFFTTSVAERETRAAAISLILTATAAAVWAGVMLLAGPYLPQLVGMAVILGAVAAIVVSVPVGRSVPLRPGTKQEKVDERDIIFSRAEVQTENYESYYRAHPELKAMDDEMRALPRLGEPGGRWYDPANGKLMRSMFDWLEDIRPLVDGEVAGDRVEMSPQDAAKRVKGFAKFLGAKLVGVTKLNQAYVYSHVGRGLGKFGEEINLDHEYAIAVAVQMDRQAVRQAPTMPTSIMTCRGYVECAVITQLLARYIRSLGYPAMAHVDANYRVMCVPIAVDAGLGELSRMGYLIARKYGPRVRLGVVTTSLPMATDSPVNLGVKDFCAKCRKCALNCPSKAIPLDDELKDVRGVKKWELNREACYKFWRQTGTDCAICMSVCTFSKPASFLHGIVRFLIRRNALARRIAVIGDDVMYGKRPRSARLPDWMKAGL
jgi:ferredoxin